MSFRLARNPFQGAQPEKKLHFVVQLADSGCASLAIMTFSDFFTNLLS